MSAGTSASSRFAEPPRHAVVIGRWGDDTALVRTDDGTTFEVRVPKALRDGFDVGAELRIDPAGGAILGWGPVGVR